MGISASDTGATETTDYHQVIPLLPQPESTTTVTEGANDYHTGYVSTSEEVERMKQPEYHKRTPQKHRQYWTAFWVAIEQGGMIRTKGGLLKLKGEIEEMVG